MSIIQNPFVLGVIVTVLVYVIRRFKLPVEGLKALWLTMFVAIIVAIADRMLGVGLPNILVCEMVSEPVGFLTCLMAIAQTIVKEAGVIFVATEIIYQVLRREMILGERI